MKGHCRDCGFDNPEDERYCQACNADLEYQDIMTSGNNGNERQTARYRALKDAADKTLAGTMSLEDFGKFLQTASTSLQERAHEIMTEVHDGNYQEESPEEVNLGLEGLHGYEEAMHEMWRYTTDRSPDHLEQGLAMAWDANERILAAMRMNRETRQAILEEFTRLYEEL